MRERADSFLSTLAGAIKNYVIPSDYSGTMPCQVDTLNNEN